MRKKAQHSEYIGTATERAAKRASREVGSFKVVLERLEKHSKRSESHNDENDEIKSPHRAHALG
jgi:hypothetical protein